MGRFRTSFPDFESFDDSVTHVKDIPQPLLDATIDVLIGSCDEDPKLLRQTASALWAIVGKAAHNWEVGALLSEIKSACHVLLERGFEQFMDGFLNAFELRMSTVDVLRRQAILDALNRALLSGSFGYAVEVVPNTVHVQWRRRSYAEDEIAALCAVGEALSDVSRSASESIQQAVRNLSCHDSGRSAKDALRDVMSAMESLVKTIAKEADLKQAFKKLRAMDKWGPDEILKDGLSVWDRIHATYEDVRHGQIEKASLPLEEAAYWISRIIAYVNYLSSRRRLLASRGEL